MTREQHSLTVAMDQTTGREISIDLLVPDLCIPVLRGYVWGPIRIFRGGGVVSRARRFRETIGS